MYGCFTRGNHKKRDILQGDYWICIPTIFGNIRVADVVKFLEMSHLLGASYFTFYDYNISDSARKMFSSYQRKGLAQVCPWNLSTYITVQDVHYHFYKRRSPPVTQNKFLKRKLSKPTGYPRNLITLTLSLWEQERSTPTKTIKRKNHFALCHAVSTISSQP